MSETYEVSVLSEDVRPGDILLDAALGGTWDKRVDAVRVYPEGVEIDLGVERVQLARSEIVSVRRQASRFLGGVHPLFVDLLDSIAGR